MFKLFQFVGGLAPLRLFSKLSMQQTMCSALWNGQFEIMIKPAAGNMLLDARAGGQGGWGGCFICTADVYWALHERKCVLQVCTELSMRENLYCRCVLSSPWEKMCTADVYWALHERKFVLQVCTELSMRENLYCRCVLSSPWERICTADVYWALHEREFVLQVCTELSMRENLY